MPFVRIVLASCRDSVVFPLPGNPQRRRINGDGRLMYLGLHGKVSSSDNNAESKSSTEKDDEDGLLLLVSSFISLSIYLSRALKLEKFS